MNGATVAFLKFQSAARDISNIPQKLTIFGRFSVDISGQRPKFKHRCGGAFPIYLSSLMTLHTAKFTYYYELSGTWP